MMKGISSLSCCCSSSLVSVTCRDRIPPPCNLLPVLRLYLRLHEIGAEVFRKSSVRLEFSNAKDVAVAHGPN